MYDDNALAIILLCSYLNSKVETIKPYTAIQWGKLADRILASKLNEPADLMNLSKEELKMILKISDEESERINQLLSRGVNLALKLENLESKGIKVLTRSDKKYPTRLKKRLGKHTPPLLYYAGDLSLLNIKSVAIVGSRNIGDEGQKIAQDLANSCTKDKLAIVSGGAKGIDIISEQTALNSGGVVVSFIADSLERKIKNKEIRNDIMSGKKLLLSSQNPDLGFSPGYAMNRNKYIYALSSGAFVISADYNKGGTWAGASENMKNKWVPTFVYDNNINDGNKELIKRGANPFKIIENLDLIEITNIKYEQPTQVDLFSMSKVVENKEVYEMELYDVYDLILPRIKQILIKEKTLEELCKIMNINKTQMSSWLKRCIEDGHIEKIYKPVRYLVKD